MAGLQVGSGQFDKEHVTIGLFEDTSDVHDDIVEFTLFEEDCCDHEEIFQTHLSHLCVYGFKFRVGFLEENVELFLDGFEVESGEIFYLSQFLLFLGKILVIQIAAFFECILKSHLMFLPFRGVDYR